MFPRFPLFLKKSYCNSYRRKCFGHFRGRIPRDEHASSIWQRRPGGLPPERGQPCPRVAIHPLHSDQIRVNPTKSELKIMNQTAHWERQRIARVFPRTETGHWSHDSYNSHHSHPSTHSPRHLGSQPPDWGISAKRTQPQNRQSPIFTVCFHVLPALFNPKTNPNSAPSERSSASIHPSMNPPIHESTHPSPIRAIPISMQNYQCFSPQDAVV